MYKNLVFDFDGTIVQSLEGIYKKITDNLDIETPPFHEIRKYPSHELYTLFEGKMNKLQIAALLLQARTEYKEILSKLDPVIGIKETLKNLNQSGARLFLCTSNSKQNAKNFLKLHGLEDHFETIVGAQSLFGKAHGIKKTLKQFKLAPHETIYIGDETRDLQAANKAGIGCALVTWGFNERSLLERYQPKFLFDNAHELLTLIKVDVR